MNKLLNKFRQYIGFRIFNPDNLYAMILRNQGRPMISIILRLWVAMGGKLSLSMLRLLKQHLKVLNKIATKSGLPGLVVYLKACSTLLMQSASGHKIDDTGKLKVRVSRTNRGLPRIIPKEHRLLIYNDHYLYIRLYLTIWSVYRDILIPGKLKLNTITDPYTGIPGLSEKLSQFIPEFFQLYFPNRKPFLNNDFPLFPILKSSPNTGISKEFGTGKESLYSSHPFSMIRSAYQLYFSSLCGDFQYITRNHSLSLTPYGTIWYMFEYIALNADDIFPFTFFSGSAHLGKLGLKEEAAGKIRVFAMVDCWTQWALAPLHKYIFGLLRKLPMDGTFDQLRPLKRLVPRGLYSLDLSSATDRLPISLQRYLVAYLARDPAYAKSWSNLLVGRSYYDPSTKSNLIYGVGQPMGALSSWAMLALTHHFLVFCAAKLSGNPVGKFFKNYAILGDDIVLADHEVAKSYLRLMRQLGVEINTSKSVLSPASSGLEFAKRFFKYPFPFSKPIDLTPIPFAELASSLLSVSEAVQFAKKHNLKFNTLLYVLGAGYRVIGKCNSPFESINLKMKILRLAQTEVSTLEELYNVLNLGNSGRVSLELSLRSFLNDRINDLFDRFNKLNSKLSLVDTRIFSALKDYPYSWYYTMMVYGDRLRNETPAYVVESIFLPRTKYKIYYYNPLMVDLLYKCWIISMSVFVPRNLSKLAVLRNEFIKLYKSTEFSVDHPVYGWKFRRNVIPNKDYWAIWLALIDYEKFISSVSLDALDQKKTLSSLSVWDNSFLVKSWKKLTKYVSSPNLNLPLRSESFILSSIIPIWGIRTGLARVYPVLIKQRWLGVILKMPLKSLGLSSLRWVNSSWWLAVIAVLITGTVFLDIAMIIWSGISYVWPYLTVSISGIGGYFLRSLPMVLSVDPELFSGLAGTPAPEIGSHLFGVSDFTYKFIKFGVGVLTVQTAIHLVYGLGYVGLAWHHLFVSGDTLLPITILSQLGFIVGVVQHFGHYCLESVVVQSLVSIPYLFFPSTWSGLAYFVGQTFTAVGSLVYGITGAISLYCWRKIINFTSQGAVLLILWIFGIGL